MQAGHRFQMSVEAPVEWVRLIRVAGALDRTAAAALLRLVDAQLSFPAAAGSPTCSWTWRVSESTSPAD